VYEGKNTVDYVGRGAGLAVFLIGIGLLVMVFIWTNQTLVAPAGSAKQPIDLTHMGTKLAWDLGRLFICGFLASSIAGRGAQMYAGSGHLEAGRRLPPA
jgi:hypothetical protein